MPGESGGWVTATTAVRSIIERRIPAPRPVTASVVGLNQRVLVVLRPSKAARTRDQHRYRMPFTPRQQYIKAQLDEVEAMLRDEEIAEAADCWTVTKQ